MSWYELKFYQLPGWRKSFRCDWLRAPPRQDEKLGSGGLNPPGLPNAASVALGRTAPKHTYWTTVGPRSLGAPADRVPSDDAIKPAWQFVNIPTRKPAAQFEYDPRPLPLRLFPNGLFSVCPFRAQSREDPWRRIGSAFARRIEPLATPCFTAMEEMIPARRAPERKTVTP
jgi:hypothetical protein